MSAQKYQPRDENEAQASRDIDVILDRTRPQGLVHGVTSGVGYILGGALGACGILALSPFAGAYRGHERSGLKGSFVGGVKGAVTGVVQAANVAAGGIVCGVAQIVRGVATMPTAVAAPIQGKWWNSNEGQWVATNLHDEAKWLKTQAIFDEDILGENALPPEERELTDIPEEWANDPTSGGVIVKDLYYYDLLGVDPTATPSMIQRRYMIIARKFSPDRCGANPQAQQKFQQIGEAYVVLANPELRERYDKLGREGLFAIQKEEEDEENVDLTELYGRLYGSEKFDDYVGRLAATTSASIAEPNESTISLADARLLQKRRVTRLAIKLAERLDKWAVEDMQNAAKADWQAQAEYLSDASYGVELVHVIGNAYSLAACQFLGSLSSGVGMPSIRDWANAHVVALQKQQQEAVTKISSFYKGGERRSLTRELLQEMDKDDFDSDEIAAEEKLKESDLFRRMLNFLWAQTVVDITNTLHEAVQMVLMDLSQSAEVRKKRGEALAVLGEIFEHAQGGAAQKQEEQDEQKFMEEIAFYSILDTVRREEEARQHARASF